MNDEENKCDKYSMFIKQSLADLKNKGICYTYTKKQAEEIKRKSKYKVIIKEDEGVFTLSVEK